MKRIYKFIIGAAIFISLTKLHNLKEQVIGISSIVGFIAASIIFGTIAYLIFGRKKSE